MRVSPGIPTYKDLLWPTLEVLQKTGGSASIAELSAQVPHHMGLADEVAEVLHGDGPQTEVEYRLAWARTDLKRVGAVHNTARGVWTITSTGREIATEEALLSVVRERDKRRRGKKKRADSTRADPPNDTEAPPEDDWQEDLLAILRKISPDAFERLCQRILRESGFTTVEVTGRSGDGGIDGAGVLRVNLISFHVRFQCKRYAATVPVRAGDIRDFRGAMVGRADKGLFMTTGRFTKDAAREAVRDGAPAIDLIDGLALCEHLKELELGVSTQMVESVSIHPEFFALRIERPTTALTMLKYRVALEESEEGYSVWIPGLPGCASQGSTEEEALANITDAVREYLGVAAENAAGMETREIEPV